MFEDIQFIEISSAYEQVNNIQRCVVAVKGATDAQLGILEDLIQSKRKQVGQYHELAGNRAGSARHDEARLRVRLSSKAHLPQVNPLFR